MAFGKLFDKTIRKLVWTDVSLLKLSVLFFTLFLVTAWSGFRNLVLGIGWHWHLGLGILFALPLLKKMFSK